MDGVVELDVLVVVVARICCLVVGKFYFRWIIIQCKYLCESEFLLRHLYRKINTVGRCVCVCVARTSWRASRILTHSYSVMRWLTNWAIVDRPILFLICARDRGQSIEWPMRRDDYKSPTQPAKRQQNVVANKIDACRSLAVSMQPLNSHWSEPKTSVAGRNRREWAART